MDSSFVFLCLGDGWFWFFREHLQWLRAGAWRDADVMGMRGSGI